MRIVNGCFFTAQLQASYSVSGVIEIEFAARTTVEQSTVGVDNRD